MLGNPYHSLTYFFIYLFNYPTITTNIIHRMNITEDRSNGRPLLGQLPEEVTPGRPLLGHLPEEVSTWALVAFMETYLSQSD